MTGIFQKGMFWVAGLAAASLAATIMSLRDKPPVEGEDPPEGFVKRLSIAALLALATIIAGACVAAIRSPAWSAPLFFVGFGGILALTARNRRLRHASPVLRRIVDLADATLTAILIAGVLMLANALAFSYGERPFDLTSEGAFTLSSQSESAVRSLKRPLKFTIVLASANAGARAGQLLELYKRINPKNVSIESIERYSAKDRLKFDDLKKLVPDVATTQGGGVVIEFGEGKAIERVVVRDAELFERSDPSASAPSVNESTFRGEDVITSAILRLERGKRRNIGFVVGHGESALESMDPRLEGLGLFRSRLEVTGFQVASLSLLTEDVPAEFPLLVVAGPKKPFATIEVNRLRQFMLRGGRLIVIISGTPRAGLDEFLAEYNIAVDPRIVIDPRMNLMSNMNWVVVQTPGDVKHPIVSALTNAYAAFPIPGPIRLLGAEAEAGRAPRDPNRPETPGNPRFKPLAILQTSRFARSTENLNAARNDPNAFQSGPFAVVAAVSETKDPGESGKAPEPDPRMVVISSAYFPDNLTIIQSGETNLDLLSNSVNWLRGESELVGIAPKTHVSRLIVGDSVFKNRLVAVPTILSLAVIVCAGIFTYLSRRE